MVRNFGEILMRCGFALTLVMGLMTAMPVMAQTADQPSGKIDWGLWIDGDGCMHWYADGGFEGYMVPRRNPETGRAVCLKRHACLAQNADELFVRHMARSRSLPICVLSCVPKRHHSLPTQVFTVRNALA